MHCLILSCRKAEKCQTLSVIPWCFHRKSNVSTNWANFWETSQIDVQDYLAMAFRDKLSNAPLSTYTVCSTVSWASLDAFLLQYKMAILIQDGVTVWHLTVSITILLSFSEIGSFRPMRVTARQWFPLRNPARNFPSLPFHLYLGYQVLKPTSQEKLGLLSPHSSQSRWLLQISRTLFPDSCIYKPDLLSE